MNSCESQSHPAALNWQRTIYLTQQWSMSI